MPPSTAHPNWESEQIPNWNGAVLFFSAFCRGHFPSFVFAELLVELFPLISAFNGLT